MRDHTVARPLLQLRLSQSGATQSPLPFFELSNSGGAGVTESQTCSVALSYFAMQLTARTSDAYLSGVASQGLTGVR
ncbi:uncharacterized protein LAESUDRAFT_535024 [Laetiporus sulphureus 93-53]|uniref:Uncharacterized protein n=1 Tax=Laetiporus sulphureus 93-53 TaxID=1314785 RepID=A0A165B9L9_9APHY|nr:uncharacterized protein LAESUDRAFT_535024 [Laetiporus sulphureus 93-53]KZT00560.1 hypothetical protein LAESUDRAFT_535024 [Laetiporus sulphureus 93-53]